jgi:putative colanic acid biosynthesis glycosyltransferase
MNVNQNHTREAIKPKAVSIITVVRNGANFFERSIISVLNQNNKGIEYIVIDGGSTDGTLDIIKRYSDQISYWISEPDKGIYDAMNKGIKASNGEWIFFLGCDDYLISDQSINKLLNHAANNVKIVFGDVIYSDGYRFRSSLGVRTLISNSVHHQGCIYKSMLFDNFLYDPATKICGDYELNLISFLKGYEFQYVNEVISFCQIGGVTTTSRKNAYKEINFIRGKYMSFIMNFLASQWYYFMTNLAEIRKYISQML